MCQVNFIEEFNSFILFAKDNVLSAQERSFWMALFYVCNSWAMRHYNPQTKTADWPDDFIIVTNEEIYLLANLNKKAILTVRNQLKQRNLIDFKQGVGNTGKKPMYKLRYLSLEVGSKNAPNYAPNYGPNYGTNYAPNYGPNYGPNSFPTLPPTAARDSNYININKNGDINQQDTHGYIPASSTRSARARAQYMGLDNKLRPARFDGAYLTSARARGAIAQRLLEEFDGDQASDDAHSCLCELMEWGMPPEIIEDAMEGQKSTIGWCARLRALANMLGYSEEPGRRDWVRCLEIAHGDQEKAARLYQFHHTTTEAIEDE